MTDYQANVMTDQKCGTNRSANCAAQTDRGDIGRLCVGKATLKGAGDGDFYSIFHDDVEAISCLITVVDTLGDDNTA